MLSLNHLSPNSPKNSRELLLIRNKLPSSMKLPADPVNNIWYFYNTITCNAYLDGHKILIVLSIPLLDNKVMRFIKYTTYHYLSVVCRLEDKNLDLTAKYDLSVEALMINKERTKYALLSSNDLDACNNRYMPFCNPKSPIYQINLSKSCIIALFLKKWRKFKKIL